MRVLLITGKGGVGKTSVAAATGLRAAAAGLRTLVMSTDPAHSLADALDTELSGQPVEVAPRLEAEQLDARRHLEDNWRQIQEYLIALLSWGGVDEVEAEELSVVPGLEELFGLLDVRRHVEAAAHDLLVVDCAPTAETLRLLSLPHALGWYLERVFPVQRKVANVVRPMLGRVTTMPLPQDRVLEAVEGLHATLGAVRAILTDGERTTVRLVTNLEKIVVAEAQRTYTHLALFGYHVDAVIVNRMLPEEVTDPYFARWKALQSEHLEAVRERFHDVPVLTAPLFADEPLGPEGLAPLAEAAYGDRDVAAVLHRGRPLRVERTGDGYVLSLALPLVDKRELDVFRRADELYVKVGASTRSIALPAALRRCAVVGAGISDERLEVRFAEPDIRRSDEAVDPAGAAAPRSPRTAQGS